MKKQWLKIWISSLLLSVGVSFAADKIYTPWNNNLAIKGYDSVAYFIENAPVKGSKKYAYQWQGATWLFKNATNRTLFIASPNNFAPQFGGYCAYAVANNSTAGIDPTQFTIHNDKLYLNYNKKIQEKWLNNRDNYIDNAESNWPNLLAQ
ncbi:YHS domain-containing (seleno)protein [Reinekea sp.]|jgi:hypothetical protein|uniref:YHS domain-containing (seleno)protein n=1 Tax=Reinekea sp. TaxID=1970455 RepID=UPI003989972C